VAFRPLILVVTGLAQVIDSSADHAQLAPTPLLLQE
jgi:hypothetical protein